MTIQVKAEKEKLDVAQVVAIAASAGKDVSDINRDLTAPEAMKLGKAVKEFLGGASANTSTQTIESNEVLFWSTNVKHTVFARNERIKFDGHILRLRKDTDASLIKTIRSLKVNDIFEVLDQPFDEDSDEYMLFQDMLEGIVFTGHTKERSKAGVKAVRAMFSPSELTAMGEFAFDPKRLILKALRSKSCVKVVELKK